MDSQGISIINRHSVLKIDHPHAVDAEGVLRAGNVNARLAIEIAILRIIASSTVINKVQAVNTEVCKLDRAYTWVATACDIECGPGRFRCAIFR